MNDSINAVKLMRAILEEAHDTKNQCANDTAGESGRHNPGRGAPRRSPLYREKLQEAFPGSDVQPAEKLKGCVADGACRYGANIRTGGLDVVIDDAHKKKARSSFGLKTVRRGKAVFVPLVGKGEPLPCEIEIPKECVPKVRSGLLLMVRESFSKGGSEAAQDLETIDDFILSQAELSKVPAGELVNARLMFRVNADESVVITCHFEGPGIPPVCLKTKEREVISVSCGE